MRGTARTQDLPTWIPSDTTASYCARSVLKRKRKGIPEDAVDELRVIAPTVSTTMACHFRHTEASGRGHQGRRWHSNPPASWWPGQVPGCARLCSRCYQMGYRAACACKIPTLPTYEHNNRSTPQTTTGAEARLPYEAAYKGIIRARLREEYRLGIGCR